MEYNDRENFLKKIVIELRLVKYYNFLKNVTPVLLSKRPSANILSVLFTADRVKKRYNARHRPVEYQEDDLIYIYLH